MLCCPELLFFICVSPNSADCFRNEAATADLQLLIIAPVDGSQNKLSSAPKYVKGCYYTSQGRAPSSRFCFETVSWYL